MATDYTCEVCDKAITGDDIEARHSTASGGDCHAECCPLCEAEKRYLDNPRVCPMCGSDAIHPVHEAYDHGAFFVDIECHTCEAGWSEVYKMTGISIFERGGTVK